MDYQPPTMDYGPSTMDPELFTIHNSPLPPGIPELRIMEPGVKQYLLRILNTLSLGLVWLALNSTFGIMYDHAFVHDHITWGNILFYIWFLLSLGAYLWWVIHVWSKPINFEE